MGHGVKMEHATLLCIISCMSLSPRPLHISRGSLVAQPLLSKQTSGEGLQWVVLVGAICVCFFCACDFKLV